MAPVRSHDRRHRRSTSPCGDVVPGCTAEFDGLSDDDLLTAVGAHTASDHDLATVSPEFVSAVRSAITTR
jgi:predicted small metal-binding protein